LRNRVFPATPKVEKEHLPWTAAHLPPQRWRSIGASGRNGLGGIESASIRETPPPHAARWRWSQVGEISNIQHNPGNSAD